MLVWVDIETTGLDPAVDQILEIGIILTTDRLSEIARWSRAVRFDKVESLKRRNPEVFTMHHTSGLLAECEVADFFPDVVTKACEFLHAHDATNLPMCGNTIRFDRQFLAQDAPELHKLFHYRSVDVSTLKVLWAAWEIEPWTPPPVKAHRSLADLDNSIAELKHYAKQIAGSPCAV